jgi:hypothetical protein
MTRAEPVVKREGDHGCCGCVCDVCANGHKAGDHSLVCRQRFASECVPSEQTTAVSDVPLGPESTT